MCIPNIEENKNKQQTRENNNGIDHKHNCTDSKRPVCSVIASEHAGSEQAAAAPAATAAAHVEYVRFKERTTQEQRSQESARMLARHPDRIPVIIERARRCETLPQIEKSKFLVPLETTFGQLCHMIRKRIKLEPHVALFVFAGDNVMPSTGEPMTAVFEKHHDKDGFLYCTYQSENVFGTFGTPGYIWDFYVNRFIPVQRKVCPRKDPKVQM